MQACPLLCYTVPMETIKVTHPFPPLYRQDSEILILGSFPSVKSRDQGFFYGHPQNRFWKVTAAVFDAPVPGTIEEKKLFLFDHHIALWDVIASCEIRGSSDASIRNAVPTDLAPILAGSRIRRIFANGRTAWSLFQKYQKPLLERENSALADAVYLPSTSPANAAKHLEDLIADWSVLRG